jgi:hypothetical protein
MSIDVRTSCTVFNVPPKHDRTTLSSVAANYSMSRALYAQEDSLIEEYGKDGVDKALSVMNLRGQYLAVNSITSTLEKLKAWQATDPYKNDYPDVRGQREKGLAEVIAEAEESDALTMPAISQHIAAIVTSALFWEANRGSLEAADVLLSEHVPQVWEQATGNAEVPQDVFPAGSVAIVCV